MTTDNLYFEDFDLPSKSDMRKVIIPFLKYSFNNHILFHSLKSAYDFLYLFSENPMKLDETLTLIQSFQTENLSNDEKVLRYKKVVNMIDELLSD